jgi:Bacteriophage tail sheath protein
MPSTLTYPGVYVEEVPSGVRTITPVSTSVTAFIGFTARGATNDPQQIFSIADFEREFGGLNVDSDVSYAVQQYFQNGGAQAWIVRVAAGAAAAGISILNAPGGTQVLDVTAPSEGAWGNRVRVDVDYDTSNPASLFNITATELLEQGGVLTPVRTETYRNLTMNALAPNDAVATVNAASSLIRLSRDGAATGLLGTTHGTSTSGDLAGVDLGQLNDDRRRLAITIDGDGPYEFDIFEAGGSITGANENARITNLANRIQAAVQALNPGSPAFANFTAARDGTRVVMTSGADGEGSSVRVGSASTRNAATFLELGLANGGREADAAALMRPAQNGTVGSDLGALDLTTLPASASVDVTTRVQGLDDVGPTTVELWAAAADRPTSLEALRSKVQSALTGVSQAAPELAGARVSLIDNRLRVEAGGNPNARLAFADGGVANTIGISAAGGAVENVSSYSLGVGSTSQAQAAPVAGADGTPPTTANLRGSRLDKTGFYALEKVDIFNIVCLPGVSDPGLLAEVISYCEERRAFAIVDLPAEVDSLTEARNWVTANAGADKKNAAAYFPRFVAADPVQSFRPRAFPASGAVAGVYARTDTQRGVWKAPAGTDAVVRGAQRLAVTLSDPENGVLNPLGLNSLRTFPIFGSVVWGARTLAGADQLASEWKYVPIRRLALFIEESLYRGTKWVVFEPNDEPLWAQIRLNVGAFMRSLFQQGAFQGASPREAYFVKCDKETTTQNDIDRGIVNILVGFAPLKPAEFVVIRIQQIAGQLET